MRTDPNPIGNLTDIANHPPVKLLLVEDNADDALLIKKILNQVEQIRFDIIWKNDLTSALRDITEDRIDIILLDLALPDSERDGTLEAFQKRYPQTPIVIITGDNDLRAAFKSVGQGAQDYLFKSDLEMPLMFRTIKYALERQRFSQALNRSEARFQRVVSQNADSLIILDHDHVIRYMNPAAETLFAAMPEIRAGAVFPFGFGDAKSHFELEIAKKENCVAVAEVRVGRIEWENEKAFLLSLRDITERKRLEKELRCYELIISTVGDPMFILDEKLRFRTFNKACMELFSVPGEDITGRPLGDVLGQRAFEEYWETMLNQCLEGRQGTCQVWHDTVSAKKKHFTVSAHPVADNDQGVNAIVINARDTTELKESEQKRSELEAQLRYSHKMEAVGTLAGGIAHDFNNILFPIVGYTEMCMEDLPEESPLRENLKEVLESANRAKNLIRQLLSFSRPSEEERRSLNLQPVVKEALKLLRSSIPSSIEIESDIDENCGPILGDAVQIHQLVMHLCTNAFSAMENQGGVLRVSLEERDMSSSPLPLNPPDGKGIEPGKYVVLEVDDTGCGMEKKILDRIFEPYFTTDHGKTVGGAGLGLSVVHGIVENHRGRIFVESQPGRGTRVVTCFPKLTPASSSDLPPSAQEDEKRKQKRILVVDDEQAVLRLMKHMLKREGFEVTAMGDSTEALALFKQAPDRFDLVITDQTMPRITGMQLAGKMLQVRKDIPIVLSSGYNDKNTTQKALSSGIRRVIQKPIMKKELLDAIGLALKSRGVQKNNP